MVSLAENIERTAAVMPRHITGLRDVNRETLEALFSLASDLMKQDAYTLTELRKGKVLGTLFYQPSTRTRLNFETAAQRLGMGVTGFADAATTRAGDFYQESLRDVIRFTSELVDIIALRHFESGAAELARQYSIVPLINAGDGYNQHPTQALGDIFTMLLELGGFTDKTIGYVGDLNVRSLKTITHGLCTLGIKQFVFLLPPQKSVPDEIVDLFKAKNVRYELVDNVVDLLQKVDLVETIGVNHPNHNESHVTGSKPHAVMSEYIISMNSLRQSGRLLKPIPILHPGPRTNEITVEVDELECAKYFVQARNGMWMRMALILALTN